MAATHGGRAEGLGVGTRRARQGSWGTQALESSTPQNLIKTLPASGQSGDRAGFGREIGRCGRRPEL